MCASLLGLCFTVEHFLTFPQCVTLIVTFVGPLNFAGKFYDCRVGYTLLILITLPGTLTQAFAKCNTIICIIYGVCI